MGEVASSEDLYLGIEIGNEFRIESRLGAGGMGAVYRAVQKLTERNVAIKVLHRHLYDETLLRRFRQEAQIISKLSHPNIITVYKYGEHTDGTLFIAMEYVQGSPLDAVLENHSQGFDVDRALPLMIQMADALAYAHEQKIVHRDIKPENVILTRLGRTESVKLLDFGIAKMLDGNSALTKTGMMCGSPMFMSPEQWQQVRDIDGRTDIYSLGCVFYQMMTGKLPHNADSVLGFMLAHLNNPVTPVLDASRTLSVLPELAEVITRCIQRDRTDRYPDAYALVEALKEAQSLFDLRRRSGSVAPPAPASNTANPRNLASMAARIDAMLAASDDVNLSATILPSTPPPMPSGSTTGPNLSVSAPRPSTPPISATRVGDEPEAMDVPVDVDDAQRDEDSDDAHDEVPPLSAIAPSKPDVTSALRAITPVDDTALQQAKRVHFALIAVGSFLLGSMAIALLMLR